jgi:hypothetical protein
METGLDVDVVGKSRKSALAEEPLVQLLARHFSVSAVPALKILIVRLRDCIPMKSDLQFSVYLHEL